MRALPGKPRKQSAAAEVRLMTAEMTSPAGGRGSGNAAALEDAHSDSTPMSRSSVQSDLELAIRAAVVSGSQHPDTDLANAYRVIANFGDNLMFVPGIGWYTWEAGGPWRQSDYRAREIVAGLSRKINREVAAVAALYKYFNDREAMAAIKDMVDRLQDWAKSTEFSPRLEAALRLAEPMLAVDADRLDADPDLLGLPDGVLELATGQHREHRQADRITRVAGCTFDPTATAPTWERFLAEILDHDAELIDFIGRLAGYALTGRRGEHVLIFLWGFGANGKSTFLGILQIMLGDYAGTASPDLLLQRGGTEHPCAIADLQGKRLMVVSETGEGGKLNEDRVKWLTGGDRLKARRMRENFYEFQPQHVLILQTNYRPRATGTDEGLWRRVRLVPFTVTIPEAKRDTTLPDKLKAELPGILVWALAGLKRYRASGLTVPAKVRAATTEYRTDSDQIGAFIADCCTVHRDCKATAGDLFRAYADHCQRVGERPRSQRDFGMRLAERGFEQARTGNARKWRGIGLRSNDANDGSDRHLAMNEDFDLSCSRHSQKTVTSVTCDTTTANDYRQASGK